MKKTLAALAVLGAFAGSAVAADVTLYGVLDQALSYTYTDVKNFDGTKAVDGENTLEMATGINAGSRFGLKGVEDLGNGYKVGFKLENGFNGDDGTLGQGSRLFGREAALTVYGPFGELAFGRMGGIGSAAGTYDLVAYADAFDGGDNAVWGFAHSDRYDNMVTYATPRLAGLQLVAQYSFKTNTNADQIKNTDPVEGESTAERYASVGLTGEYGPAQFVVGYELTKYSTLERSANFEPDDGQLVFVGGNYDFGVAKLFAEAQYFAGKKDVFDFPSDAFVTDALKKNTEKNWQGYGLHVGTIVPVAEGELTVGAYYVDAKLKDIAYSDRTGFYDDMDADYLGLAARYTYPLSKRTTLYVGGGYAEATVDAPTNKGAAITGYGSDQKGKVGNAYVGLTHTF